MDIESQCTSGFFYKLVDQFKHKYTMDMYTSFSSFHICVQSLAPFESQSSHRGSNMLAYYFPITLTLKVFTAINLNENSGKKRKD